MTKFAIVTNTYKRPDGKTPELLKRAMESVLSQVHCEWKMFLIGDKYEDDQEFKQLSNIIPPNKIKSVNRLNAIVERDIYPMPSKNLWCAGGVSSTLYGIDLALKEGFEYICKLDHDDWWSDAHLSNFNAVISAHPDLFFLASRSYYKSLNNIKPRRPTSGSITPYHPKPGRIINSSTCVKYSDTDIRGRDVFKHTGQVKPADMDLWNRLSAFMKNNNKQGYLSSEVTCYHLEEGFGRTSRS